MKEFDRLISEQLKTMDKLLFLQSEIERCQEIERQLKELENHSEAGAVREELGRMKEELAGIQQMFEQQTEGVIQCYQRNQKALS